jgi:hypothetical protein
MIFDVVHYIHPKHLMVAIDDGYRNLIRSPPLPPRASQLHLTSICPY